MPPSEDEASLGDDEFVVSEDPVEQERFKRRLMATANSLKKKQQQLQADQDLLADRWTEVLAPRNINSNAPPRVTQNAGCYPDWRKKGMRRLTGHLVVVTERHFSQKLSLHSNATHIKTSRHGEIRQTCETYWRTRQGKHDRSTDRVGTPRLETVTVMPATNSAGPNTVDKAHWSYVVI